MKVVWSPLALNKVEEVADIIRYDKPGAARKWVQDLLEAAEALADLPRRGRIVPEIQRSEIRELLLGNYRMIYRIEDTVVSILTVRHGRQLLEPEDLDSLS